MHKKYFQEDRRLSNRLQYFQLRARKFKPAILVLRGRASVEFNYQCDELQFLFHNDFYSKIYAAIENRILL